MTSDDRQSLRRSHRVRRFKLHRGRKHTAKTCEGCKWHWQTLGGMHDPQMPTDYQDGLIPWQCRNCNRTNPPKERTA